MVNDGQKVRSGRPESANRRSWPRRLLNRLEVDRAVFYAISQRGWQFIAGPITLVLIAQNFTAEVQGFYYTFWGVIALQTFFELALPQTVITTASHQWRFLSLGANNSIQGDPDSLSRLAHLTRLALVLFSACGTLFFLGVGIFGLWFFDAEGSSDAIRWRAPWLSLILLSGLTFLTTPLFSILEGCNRVASVYQLQFLRSILGNAVVWAAIPLGFGLWVPALATLVRLLCEIAFLVVVYRSFFGSMVGRLSGAKIDWRREVWPFQYRILLKGMLSYFNADMMGPVIFHYHGAVWAGQLGMTWQILGALRGACSSWVRARYTQMGILVAGGEFRELDRVFYRVASIGLAVMAVSGAAFWLSVLAIHWAGSPYATRLLPPASTGVLLLGLQASLAVEFLWTYIHSHRVSPYLMLTVIGSVISAILIWWWGALFDRIGVAAAYFVVQGCIYLPLSIRIWNDFRQSRLLASVEPSGARSDA
jgi:hypothetical protein